MGGDDLAILTVGPIGIEASKAVETLEAKGLSVAHYDMRWIKPLDELMLHEVFTKFKKVITVEDGCVQGGFGSAVVEFMADHGYAAQLKRLGMPDEFIEHGSQEQLYAECGYDAQSIIATASEMIGVKSEKMVG
jgi:1-deoxy-D-xylulose-5-phosphate synthase